MLENLPADTLPRLLRRTNLTAIAVGFVGFFVALMIAPDLAAVGLVIGLALAVINLRFIDRQAARVEVKGDQSTKAVRRQLGSKTLVRLALVTVVVVVALVLNTSLGVGIVVGLVLYESVFVANVLRAMAG